MNDYQSSIKLASLYVLFFPECGFFKVGKAKNVYARCQQLKHYWGDPDYHESLEWIAPESTVFQLEKALHLLAKKNFAASVFKGDGHTEFFEMAALDLVLHAIALYVRAGVLPERVKKGINLHGRHPVPAKPPWDYFR